MVAISEAVLKAAGPGASSADRAALRSACHALAQTRRMQLRSREVWEDEAHGRLLPAMTACAEVAAAAAAAAAAVEDPAPAAEAHALRVELALQTRHCAHLGCTNMQGASEKRMPVAGRCSVCHGPRYCSRDCQLADAARHGPMCGG